MVIIMSNLQNKLVNRLCLLEMWERFSYYGMRSLLVLYMINIIGFADTKAYVIYGLYASVCYFVPIIGGYIADRFLGYKQLIMIGTIFMCIGQLILALTTINEFLLYSGIAFVAVGTGFFKGNISILLGSIFNEGDIKNRDNGFRKFYVAINFGAFIASIACGEIAHLYGWNYAFGLAAVGMLLGLALLLSSKKALQNYGNQQNMPVEKFRLYVAINYLFGAFAVAATIGMLYYADFSIKVISFLGILIIAHVTYITTKFKQSERKGIYLILSMLLFFMSMFAIEMHLGSFINVFTDKHVDKIIFGKTIAAASLQSLNPLIIVLLGSIIGYIIRKIKAQYTLVIFGTGFVMALISFLVLYIGCSFYNENYQMNIIFLIISMTFLALSELLMAPIMSSLVTYVAPKEIRGYMVGFVMMSLSYSNIIGGVVLEKLLYIEKSDNEITNLVSLATYQNCFLKIAIAFLFLSLIYVILYKPLKKIYASYNMYIPKQVE